VGITFAREHALRDSAVHALEISWYFFMFEINLAHAGFGWHFLVGKVTTFVLRLKKNTLVAAWTDAQ